MLVVANDAEAVEADLAAGRLACPGCDGPLARHGWARRRVLRTLGDDRELRPRRGWCARCEAAHVLLPGWSVPRRRDAAEVIVAALLAKAAGPGTGRSPWLLTGRPAPYGAGCAGRQPGPRPPGLSLRAGCTRLTHARRRSSRLALCSPTRSRRSESLSPALCAGSDHSTPVLSSPSPRGSSAQTGSPRSGLVEDIAAWRLCGRRPSRSSRHMPPARARQPPR